MHNPDAAGLRIELARREGTKLLDLSSLSGGEKILAVEALILAFHSLIESPLHVIDEFTQKLDSKIKAKALEMVLKSLEIQKQAHQNSSYNPLFLLLCPDMLGVDTDDFPQIGRYVISSGHINAN